ncbi:MAG: hypothetical protein JWO81_2538 [Alphaproteobacteria bacterium]|nr:hypothetical protein [Alphaproteobacteria bacterium]
MATATAPIPAARAPTRKAVWVGRILSGLLILFLLMDGSMKLVPLQIVIDTSRDLAWPVDPATLRMLGALLIGSTLLYAWPRTSVLGAILITAYLGGAIATHARIGSPLFSHVLFGVYLGVMAWAGLWLRAPRLRALLPLVR